MQGFKKQFYRTGLAFDVKLYPTTAVLHNLFERIAVCELIDEGTK